MKSYCGRVGRGGGCGVFSPLASYLTGHGSTVPSIKSPWQMAFSIQSPALGISLYSFVFQLRSGTRSLFLLLPEQHSAASFGFPHTVRKLLLLNSSEIVYSESAIVFCLEVVDLVIEKDTQ